MIDWKGTAMTDAQKLSIDNTFKRAINQCIDDYKMGRISNDGFAIIVAEAVLDSRWLVETLDAKWQDGYDIARVIGGW